jgi:hypothetical protein
MGTTMSAAAASPSEQMYFDGAHLAHVVAYYDHLRFRRIERSWERFRSVRSIDELAAITDP